MITQARLKELLHYNSETGVFTRLVSTGGALAGSVTGTKNSGGYLQTMVDYKLYKLHRLAWLYVHGEWPADQIDHIDHIRTNNRWNNLREVTHQENHRNRTVNSNSASGITGVYWDKCAEKWRACIVIDGNNKHIGFFDDINDAAAARKCEELLYNFHDNHGKL